MQVTLQSAKYLVKDHRNSHKSFDLYMFRHNSTKNSILRNRSPIRNFKLIPLIPLVCIFVEDND